MSSTRTLADLPFRVDVPLLRRQDLDMGKLLGRGRYSQVHAVDAIRSDSLDPGCYVMKHLQGKLFRNRGHRRVAVTNALADLVLEAMYLSKLRHPHIVQLRALTLGGTGVLGRKGAIAEDYFFLLDRMEDTLDQRIQVWKRQPPTRALLLTKIQYAWQMTNALTYLHNHQILYRDFKPDNIGFLKTPQGEDVLQLYDFGLARELDDPPTNNDRLYSLSASGTRRYMAVEIFNTGRYNYKADVFSWAIVLYEMLSHIKPFADFTCQSHEELVCRLGGRPKLSDIEWPLDMSQVTQELQALLHQGWHHDWKERPSMAQVCLRLEDLLESQGVTVIRIVDDGLHQSQRHFFDDDPDFLRKKTSTSEFTVATDLMDPSDSEQDDDQPKGRRSHSERSAIGGLAA